MSTQSNSFVYTPTSSGTYTWRFRRVCTGATAPASSYTVDNLKVSYVIPYTRTECPETDLAYRFGFNTQEKDDEVYGAGNLNTALFWEYDTRIGRRWNLDPKPRVGISDYSVMDGNPILNRDDNGDCPTCPTMLVGGLLGLGVGLYDLSQQEGGLKKAFTGDNWKKSTAHLAVTTGTGVALGSGVGWGAAMGIAGTADVVDQTIQNKGTEQTYNPVQTATAVVFAGVGNVVGKKISASVLKTTISKQANAMTPIAYTAKIPKNDVVKVITTEFSIGASSSVSEKIFNKVATPAKSSGGSKMIQPGVYMTSEF